jgi:signal transduction histidine kinase
VAWWELAILILGIVGGVVAGMSYARRQERQKRQTAQMWIYDPYDPQAAPSAPSAHLGYSPGAFAPTTSASLAALAAQIAGAGDRDHLVRVASQWMVEALGLTSVVCYQHDPASMSLVTPVVAGLPIGHLPERVKFGATIFGDVARSRTHLLIENLYLDPRFPATTDAKLAYFLPLVHNGTLYGVLAALATRHQALGEPARLMIDKAVTLISATYSLTYRLGESGEVIARFERFQRMANRLSQHLEFETLFKEIVDAAVEMLDADVGILLNVNEAEQKLYPVAWAGIDTATAGLLRVRLKEDLKGLVAWARRPTRSANVLIDQRTSLASYAAIAGMTAEMVAPVLYQDQLVGILAVETRLSRFFTDDEMDLLLALASHAAIALHNARLFGDLQTSKVQLERAVADLEVARDQTEKAWIAAVEASKLKTEFINNMSHELRTPLNAVLNFTRIVLDGHAGQTNDQQKQFLGYVHDSGQHLLGLINDILDLAKIEAGRMDLRRDMTALEPILRGVMSTAVGLTRDRGLKLTLNLDPALPVLEIDGQRIRQVLLNVVSNAAKFTLKGGITVSAVRREKDVLVSVQDTGIGIKPEDLDKVFEEFRQVDGTLTRTETGTGLGMPISRRFVELHNGSMWLESVHGTGTTVYFTLPLPAPANAMKIKTQEIETPPPDGD